VFTTVLVSHSDGVLTRKIPAFGRDFSFLHAEKHSVRLAVADAVPHERAHDDGKRDVIPRIRHDRRRQLLIHGGKDAVEHGDDGCHAETRHDIGDIGFFIRAVGNLLFLRHEQAVFKKLFPDQQLEPGVQAVNAAAKGDHIEQEVH